MIAIGSQFGGPEQKNGFIRTILNRAMNVAADVRDENYNNVIESWTNPIFIVPGSIVGPDFDGFKIGHFSKKQKGLVVMIAVPQSVADGEGAPDFVVTSLRQAVGLAADYFTRKGMPFSTLKAEKIILAIEAELPSQVNLWNARRK